ncbi:unnamed protein product [Meloidogyne enterolobii]|uniref:Uncharacterized protein n=1 Tax=Meloidogyne enterolobii TaxID=390850 RepID=A0ACB1A940_MELEN
MITRSKAKQQNTQDQQNLTKENNQKTNQQQGDQNNQQTGQTSHGNNQQQPALLPVETKVLFFKCFVIDRYLNP